MYCFCLEVGAKPLTKRFGFDIIAEYLGVAQFGRVLGSGPRGRRFKSSHSDHKKAKSPCDSLFFYYLRCVEPTALQDTNRLILTVIVKNFSACPFQALFQKELFFRTDFKEKSSQAFMYIISVFKCDLCECIIFHI